MKNNRLQYSLIAIIGVLFFLVSTRLVWGWTNPTANPSSGAGAISVSSGNVGIGTASPTQKLEVGGSVLFKHPTSQTVLYLSDSTGTGQFSILTNADGTYLTNTGSYGPTFRSITGAHVFQTTSSNTERMRITNAGNVGIGTTAPGTKLQIKDGDLSFDREGTQSLSMGYKQQTTYSGFVDSASGLVILIDSNNNETTAAFRIMNNSSNWTTASELFRVQESGAVGVGTASPDANYKITTTAGGIKAENSSASQPAGYFSNAGGGPALQIGTGGFVTETRTSDPSSPVAGQIWLRTDL